MDALNPPARDRGATLVETLFATGLLALFAAAIAAPLLGRDPYALRAAVTTFAALVADARAVARTSGAGATLAIEPDGAQGFVARLYPYRPFPGAALDAPAVRTLHASAGLSASGVGEGPYALFFSSSATASSAAWSPGDGALAAEPPCSGSIQLAFSDGMRTEAHQLDCADASFR